MWRQQNEYLRHQNNNLSGREKPVMHINRGILSSFTSPCTSVLTVSNDRKLRIIRACNILTILFLNNTRVQSIKNCPLLYHINITGNRGMERLTNIAAHEVVLSACTHLRMIDIQQATNLTIENMPNIHQILAPNVKSVSILNMNIAYLPFRLHAAFPQMTSLRIENGGYFELNEELGLSHILEIPSHVRSITIHKCDIATLTELRNLNKLVIDDCPKLKDITNIKNIKILQIRNCNQLTTLRSFNRVGICEVSKCDQLQILMNLSCKKMDIGFCFGLVTLPPISTDCLIIDKCPSLVNIELHDQCHALVINACYSFEMVLFSYQSDTSYSDLLIKMTEDNNVVSIKDWYATRLCIENNKTLENIQNVYNLMELSLINCMEVDRIANLPLDSIVVEECPSLEIINGIYGVSDIFISRCDSLRDIQLMLSELRSVDIYHCPNLSLTFDGSKLYRIRANNCGVIMPLNIRPAAQINMTNVALISDIYNIDKLNSRIDELFKAGYVIMHRLHGWIDRIRYKKFKRLIDNNSRECAICQDDMYPQSTHYTRCNHAFHLVCICRWTNIRRSCPLCNGLL